MAIIDNRAIHLSRPPESFTLPEYDLQGFHGLSRAYVCTPVSPDPNSLTSMVMYLLHCCSAIERDGSLGETSYHELVLRDKQSARRTPKSPQ